MKSAEGGYIRDSGRDDRTAPPDPLRGAHNQLRESYRAEQGGHARAQAFAGFTALM
jgi:hypothetical protein